MRTPLGEKTRSAHISRSSEQGCQRRSSCMEMAKPSAPGAVFQTSRGQWEFLATLIASGGVTNIKPWGVGRSSV